MHVIPESESPKYYRKYRVDWHIDIFRKLYKFRQSDGQRQSEHLKSDRFFLFFLYLYFRFRWKWSFCRVTNIVIYYSDRLNYFYQISFLTRARNWHVFPPLFPSKCDDEPNISRIWYCSTSYCVRTKIWAPKTAVLRTTLILTHNKHIHKIHTYWNEEVQCIFKYIHNHGIGNTFKLFA